FASVMLGTATRHPQLALAVGHAAILQGALVIIAIALRRSLTRTAALLPALMAGLALFDGLAAIYFTQGTLFTIGPRPKFPVAVQKSVALGPEKFARALGSARVNPNLFFKVPTLKNYAPFRNRFHEMIVTDPALQTMALGAHRIWFAADAPQVALTNEVFAQFVRRWAELEAPLVIRHAPEQMLSPTPATARDLAAIANTAAAISVQSKIISYTPDTLALEMNAPSDGWLMVSDRWSRSWHATVNGIEQPISGANFIFRAVPVTKGSNRIEFSYRPLGMPGLVLFSWSVLGIIVALSLVRLRVNLPRLTSRENVAPAFLPAVE
ncbi:MAG: YfhO family protein, partial [Chthoniobacterales bacterium]